MTERTDIRQLPGVDSRVETGPVQFGDNWPGVFIRGDNAAYYAANLRAMLAKQRICAASLALNSLLSDLEASNTHNMEKKPE